MSKVLRTPLFLARQQQRARPTRSAIIGSLLLHAALGGGIIASVAQGTDELPEYKVYRVDLYSPPPQALGEPAAPKAAEPTIIKPPEPKTATAQPKPPPPKPVTKKPTAPSSGKSEVAKGRNPDPTASVGGEGLDVHLEGEEFPYPEYLQNIILQLNRYFRWNGAPNLAVRIGFDIMRDGSVRRIRVLNKSGNISFDLEAVSAVEQAGQRGAFGPLPEGWVADRLQVAFDFLPPGR